MASSSWGPGPPGGWPTLTCEGAEAEGGREHQYFHLNTQPHLHLGTLATHPPWHTSHTSSNLQRLLISTCLFIFGVCTCTCVVLSFLHVHSDLYLTLPVIFLLSFRQPNLTPPSVTNQLSPLTLYSLQAWQITLGEMCGYAMQGLMLALSLWNALRSIFS